VKEEQPKEESNRLFYNPQLGRNRNAVFIPTTTTQKSLKKKPELKMDRLQDEMMEWGAESVTR
jgi:hypothetical protein